MATDEFSLTTITSKSNQYIKEARLLKNKKERDEKGLFLVEGLRLAEEAVAAGLSFSYALVTERMVRDGRGSALVATLKGLTDVFLVEQELLNYCADTENAQGILIAAKKREQSADIFTEGTFFVIADRIADPGNLGTLARTALAVGADALLLLPGTVDYYNPKVVRASMGAVFNLPAYQASDNDEAYGLLRRTTVKILTAAAGGNTPYYEADLTVPLAWVFGSESEGVDDFWLRIADDTVYLPMSDHSESLNVAVSAGVLLYDTLRQRKKIKK